MKKVVWENKSNKQLCVTIPKNLGINDGDIVSIEKNKISKIVYSSVTGDLFHFGHLRILNTACELGDFHICGVLTNEAIKTYKDNPISSLKERKTIISSLRCVDMVLTQNSQSPLENLKEIKESFPHIKELIIIEGSNWNSIPDEDKIKKLGIKIVKHEYYEKLSDEKISKKIKKNGK